MNRPHAPFARLLAIIMAACVLVATLASCREASDAVPSPTDEATPSVDAASLSPLATPEPSASPESIPSASPVATGEPEPLTPQYTYEVVNVYPHDRAAFTQGLVIDGEVMYESTGRRGQSSLRLVDWQSGEVLQLHALPDQYFGEGLTLIDERLVQLTWQSHLGFVYDRDSFELLTTFEYPTEGWGITHDGTAHQVASRLIMSDGTDTLYFLDPDHLHETGRVQVYDDSSPVDHLNELEYVKGEVYANVWLTDWIVTIDPESGQVTARIDLAGLLGPEDRQAPVDVLNGIAYDPVGDRLFVTGKLWPKMFEIDLVPKR